MTINIQIQLRLWPFVRIFRGEHPDTARWRQRARDFECMADSFAARLERQPGRNARGRYCKRMDGGLG